MKQVGQKGLLYTTDILASTLFVDGWTRLGLIGNCRVNCDVHALHTGPEEHTLSEVVSLTVTISHKNSLSVSDH